MAKGYYFSFGRNRWDPTPLIVLVIIVVFAAAGYVYFKMEDVSAAESQQSAIDKAVAEMRAEAASVKVSVKAPKNMKSENYILLQLSDYNRKFEGKNSWIDVSDGGDEVEDAFMHERVRLSKERNTRVYPASMTKALTAIVIIENLMPDDYDKAIEITDEDMDYLRKEGASVAGFEVGEEVKIEDLVYGMMLPSGAECVSALADYVAGSNEKFVKLMNKIADSIGMSNSQFTNPIGLHDEDTYTTVADVALLMDYAIRNERFLNVVSTQEYTTSATNRHKKGLEMKSTLYQQGDIEMETDEGRIFGGKTGYTEEAGQCLASYMEKNGERFILVTAAAMPTDYHKQALHVDDMMRVFEEIAVSREEE